MSKFGEPVTINDIVSLIKDALREKHPEHKIKVYQSEKNSWWVVLVIQDDREIKDGYFLSGLSNKVYIEVESFVKFTVTHFDDYQRTFTDVIQMIHKVSDLVREYTKH